MDLTGQVVLITDGSRGFGRAFAQALVAAGARVAITARGASELHEIAAQLSSAADQVIAIPGDVIDPKAAPRVVAETEQRLGPHHVADQQCRTVSCFWADRRHGSP
jgi:NAD(P)-dependent dehydrogenase (short-subunit alcohol dehydrogenase family)